MAATVLLEGSDRILCDSDYSSYSRSCVCESYKETIAGSAVSSPVLDTSHHHRNLPSAGSIYIPHSTSTLSLSNSHYRPHNALLDPCRSSVRHSSGIYRRHPSAVSYFVLSTLHCFHLTRLSSGGEMTGRSFEDDLDIQSRTGGTPPPSPPPSPPPPSPLLPPPPIE